MRLLLVRHGESEGNAAGVVQGHLEYGLTAKGRQHAELTAARLAREGPEGPEVVVSSPLRRAADTAAAIAAAAGLDVRYDPRLAEYHIGEAAGLTGAQIRERFPQVMAGAPGSARPLFEGEEGREVFYERVSEVLNEARAENLRAIMVTHGGVIAAACHIAVGVPYTTRGLFHAGNGAITEVVTDRAGNMVLARHNDACHLAESEG
ncbi:MAG: histidine phosphatase family protein [Dehalococcoidia bacterium]